MEFKKLALALFIIMVIVVPTMILVPYVTIFGFDHRGTDIIWIAYIGGLMFWLGALVLSRVDVEDGKQEADKDE